MYRHIEDYKLRYTDVDVYDNIKLSSLLSLLEESACNSADELGFGYDALAKRNMGFIIVNWYIELKKKISLGDIVTVHTWPLKPKRLIFLRDFEIYVGNEKVGVATSRWCMIDTKNYTMLPTSAYFKDEDFVNYNTERSVDFNAWKIQSANDVKSVYSKIATFSDCDHYFHVNNTKYADFLTDVFSIEEFDGKFIKSVQITYAKQCKQGEKMEFVRSYDDGFYIAEGFVEGELRVQMRISFNEL